MRRNVPRRIVTNPARFRARRAPPRGAAARPGGSCRSASSAARRRTRSRAGTCTAPSRACSGPAARGRGSSEPSTPGRSTTNALTIWPRSGSGLPITALSATPACSSSALSTSNGPDPVRGGEDHVVRAAGEPEVAVLVARGAVARHVPVAAEHGRRLVGRAVVLAEQARRPAGERDVALLAVRRRRSRPRRSRRSRDPGDGSPIEPGRISAPGMLPTSSVFSVWP